MIRKSRAAAGIVAVLAVLVAGGCATPRGTSPPPGVASTPVGPSVLRALAVEPKVLLLDEPFGALDAFTREELWCTLRDLHAAQKFNVILVTHDLRESVFLADTVYCMSRSPGRFVVKRHIDLPKPRDLEVTYTSQFTEIVHELRGHIGAMRGKPGVAVPQ